MDIRHELNREVNKLSRDIDSLQNVLKRLQSYLLDERFNMIHEAGEVKSLGLMIDVHCVRIALLNDLLETPEND